MIFLNAAPLYYNRVMPYPGDIERYRDYEKVVNGVRNVWTDVDRREILSEKMARIIRGDVE